LAGEHRAHKVTATERADANTEENLRATVDAILTDAVGKQEAREKAGRAETAKAATRRLQEVIRRGAVIQQENVAAAGEAVVGATGAEPLEEQEKLHPTPELIAAGMREANRRAIERGELEDCTHIRHNGMHAVWKCRTCCEIGTYACWMETGHSSHLCGACHKTQATTTPKIRSRQVVKELLPVCLGAGHCTNEKAHPPPGEQFCLGCAVCHMESVMVEERTEAEMQAKAAAEAHKAQMETAMARSLQAVSEGVVTDAAQMEAELLAQVKATEVAELYKAQREAEQLNARNATGIAAMVA
jgi:hypothetical protein